MDAESGRARPLLVSLKTFCLHNRPIMSVRGSSVRLDSLASSPSRARRAAEARGPHRCSRAERGRRWPNLQQRAPLCQTTITMMMSLGLREFCELRPGRRVRVGRPSSPSAGPCPQSWQKLRPQRADRPSGTVGPGRGAAEPGHWRRRQAASRSASPTFGTGQGACQVSLL